MSRLACATSRLLIFAILLTLISLGAWALAADLPSLDPATLSPQHPTPNTQHPARRPLLSHNEQSLPRGEGMAIASAERRGSDTRIVIPAAWMDQNGDRVDDRLEATYRRTRQAGLQAENAPPAADLMIALDHAPTASDLARYQALGAAQVEGWGDLVYAVRSSRTMSNRCPAARAWP